MSSFSECVCSVSVFSKVECSVSVVSECVFSACAQ